MTTIQAHTHSRYSYGLLILLLFFPALVTALNLKEAVDLALINSIDIQSERIKRDIAFTRHNNALLGLLPDITLAYNYNLDSTGYWGASETKNTEFIIEQPVFYNGRELFAFLSAYYNWKQAQNNYATQKKAVLINTVNKYMDLLKKQETVRMWALEMDSALQQSIKTKKMFDLNFAAKKDVLESDSYYKLAKYNHTKADNDYQMSKIELEQYLNTKFDSLSDTDFPTIEPKDLPYYEEYAKKNSPDYENLIYAQKAARFKYKETQLARWPQLSVYIKNAQMDEKSLEYGFTVNLTGLFYSSATGSYGLQKNTNLYDTDKKNISFKASLFTGDSIKESILQGQLNYLASEYELADSQLALEKIVKKAYFSFTEARDYYDMAVTTEEAKQEIVIKNEKEFSLGLIDSMELIKSQKELSEAKVNRLNGKFNYYIAWYTLLMTIGADIEF